MKFVSVAKVDLKFKIDGVVYEVPVGGSCEVPDRIAYTVKGRGLPMKLADELATEQKPAEEAPKPARRAGKAAPVEEAPKPMKE